MANKLKETDGRTDGLPKWFLVLHFAAKNIGSGSGLNIQFQDPSKIKFYFHLCVILCLYEIFGLL